MLNIFEEHLVEEEGNVLNTYSSLEGGTGTIGVGHKLSTKEEQNKMICCIDISEGITYFESIFILKQDIKKKTKSASKKVDKKYGYNKFNSLTENQKYALLDVEFNVRGGLNTFPSYTRAVIAKDWEEAVIQLNDRHYIDTNGIKIPLKRRNNKVKELFLKD